MKNLFIILLILSSAIPATSQNLQIKSYEMHESSLDARYNISANYPQVDFGPDALMGVRGIANDINSDIIKILNGLMIPFKEQSAADTTQQCPQPENTMSINYTTRYKDNGYLSFLIETYSSPRCAAHPLTIRTSFNYSYTTKGLLTVDSLFKTDSGWLEQISKYCISELKSRAKKDQLDNIDEMITKGASAKPENFNTFTINDYTLDIHFNLYQVGPYVWGFQEVSIPWKDLLKMVDPQGPVGFLIK